MGERRGTRGLELWCKRMTEGYPGVKIENMTTSWRDGLAFCAIIHHFRPDLIDFSKLNKNDVYHNNELAFTIAEQHLGIPALLEPEDMVEFPVPDRLSILTYLSQFYQTFVVSQGSPSRIVPKRPVSSSERPAVSPTSTSPPTKVALHSAGSVRREPCAKCNLPVFIAERLNVGKQLFHRACFRCARCNSQLSLANYYETESGDFCCEICPDEVRVKPPKDVQDGVLSRSLSDEEKSASLKRQEEKDDYSSMFETALEDPGDKGLAKSYTLQSDQTLDEFTRARSHFVQSQLESSSNSDSGNEEEPLFSKQEEEPPTLPSTKPPDIDLPLEECDNDSGFPSKKQSLVSSVYSVSDENDRPPVTELEKTENSVTKDTWPVDGDANTSLVKARMRLFENIESSSVHIGTSISVKIKEDEVREEIKIEEPAPVNSKSEEILASPITISDSSREESNSVIIISDESPPFEEVDDPKESNEPQEPSKIDEDYPDDLNPFGDEEEENISKPSKPSDYDTSLNPFGSEEEGEEAQRPSPKPRNKKKIKVLPEIAVVADTPEHLKRISLQRESFNPYEEKQGKSLKTIDAQRVSLNPFWSEGEESEDKSLTEKPVPLPRASVKSMADVQKPEQYDNTMQRKKKKKPAPKPPSNFSSDSPFSSLTSSPSQSVQHSPRFTPKVSKTRKAPLPPSSTPYNLQRPQDVIQCSNISPVIESVKHLSDDWEHEKLTKEEENRNIRSHKPDNQNPYLLVPNKSTHGKWKRRKGPAPSRPIPQRRTIRSLPITDIRRELDIIEIQQQGLEKQGVRLEQIIRERFEGPNSDLDSSLTAEVEDMILQLFELVNEKNELFRKQAELMYLRRQQRLEEEHADVEYQIRCLMLQPEANKTDSDKAREEELINRLVDIVERRNEIIECLEMDRVREAEEDDSINVHMNLYTLKRDEKSGLELIKSSKKEKKKHKKEKKSKLKGHKVDADKDVDESELSLNVSPTKEKKKKKFNIF